MGSSGNNFSAKTDNKSPQFLRMTEIPNSRVNKIKKEGKDSQ